MKTQNEKESSLRETNRITKIRNSGYEDGFEDGVKVGRQQTAKKIINSISKDIGFIDRHLKVCPNNNGIRCARTWLVRHRLLIKEKYLGVQKK